MTGRIFSFGYNHPTAMIERVADLIDAGALLVDVRLKPYSRKATWNRTKLAKQFGESYLWAEGLGNRNYKGGPIDLANPQPVYARLAELLRAGKSMIIMCCCGEYDRCHRRVIIDELVKRTGAEVDRSLEVSIDFLKRQGSNIGMKIESADGKLLWEAGPDADDWMDEPKK